LKRTVIDISRSIGQDSLVYPGDPPPLMPRSSAIAAGHSYNVLELHWNTHLLTHLDAPYHFFEEGAPVDGIPLDRFIGEALVIEVEGPAVLEEHIPDAVGGLSLLFKTSNSRDWNAQFNPDHVFVSAGAAILMAQRQVNLVGVDYLSIEHYGDQAFPAHRALLGAGIPILEGLDLGAVEPGRYTLVALPLKIAGADGSPVRAVLLP
jgi:arylformamidase